MSVVKNGIVSFKENEHIWNVYGKEDIDQENVLTDKQWREFVWQYKDDELKYDGVVNWENIVSAFSSYVSYLGLDEDEED